MQPLPPWAFGRIFSHGAEGSKSDKSLGVVALVHFDLRERGLIGDKIALCGTNGAKFDDIRKHFHEKITFSNLNNLSFDQFPQVSLAEIYQFILLNSSGSGC